MKFGFSIEASALHITLPAPAPQQMDQSAYMGNYFSPPSCPRYRCEEMSGVLRSWPVTCNPPQRGKYPVYSGLVTHFISRGEKTRIFVPKSSARSSPSSDRHWKINKFINEWLEKNKHRHHLAPPKMNMFKFFHDIKSNQALNLFCA